MAGAFVIRNTGGGSAWSKPDLPNDRYRHRIPHLARNCLTVESELTAIMHTREEQNRHSRVGQALDRRMTLRSSCFAMPDKRSVPSPNIFIVVTGSTWS